jgi:hypothetical protein
VKRVVLTFVLASFAVFAVGAFAQEYPKVELTGGYSYMNFHPDIPQFTSQNFNGGGGAAVWNVTNLIGLKADFMGYAVGTGWTKKLAEQGLTASASGNLFTYMFGPQIKKHTGKFQPFGEALFGAAHSNAYATLLHCESGNCNATSGNSNNNAFAMEFGGGLDYMLNKHVQVRPVEVDYLYTRFGANGTSYTGSQNNFKYFAGVNFTLGGK